MNINAYINFEGNCKEALEFYSEVFGSKPKITTYGDMPEDDSFPMTDEIKKLILYSDLDVCGSKIMFSDVMPGMGFVEGNNITISLSGDDKDLLKTWFEKLSEGGSVPMPLGETFWSKLYGFTIDKFGIGWQVNHKEN